MIKNDAIARHSDEPDGLPALFGRMADDLTDLFDAKLALLKIELHEEIRAYIRASAMMITGAVAALVGFALLNTAAAFLISSLFQNTSLSQPARYGLGFAITSVIYLIGAGALILVGKNKLAAQAVIPQRTVAEFKKDKERIEKEI